MMLKAALDALEQIFTPPFRRVLLKTLALTFLLLLAFFVGAEKLLGLWLVLPNHWLTTLLGLLASFGLVIGLAFAITPVSFIVAGFFFDELAAIVEADIDPHAVGTNPAIGDSLFVAAKFAAVAVLVNVVALVLLLVPAVNAVVFFAANAYLLARGYFEFAALRYRTVEDAAAMRRAHGMEIFIAGFFIAVVAAIPIVNLLTPLFGAAFMVRMHKIFSLQDAAAAKRSFR